MKQKTFGTETKCSDANLLLLFFDCGDRGALRAGKLGLLSKHAIKTHQHRRGYGLMSCPQKNLTRLYWPMGRDFDWTRLLKCDSSHRLVGVNQAVGLNSFCWWLLITEQTSHGCVISVRSNTNKTNNIKHTFHSLYSLISFSSLSLLFSSSSVFSVHCYGKVSSAVFWFVFP